MVFLPSSGSPGYAIRPEQAAGIPVEGGDERSLRI
jgi:hypothetical protein